MLPILHLFPGAHYLPAMLRMESGFLYIQDKCSQRGHRRGHISTPAHPKLIVLLFEVLQEAILCVFLREIELRWSFEGCDFGSLHELEECVGGPEPGSELGAMEGLR